MEKHHIGDMHLKWQYYLSRTGSGESGSPETALKTGTDAASAARDSGIAAPLVDQGLLHVSGRDAAEFLHSQVTNSVTELAAPQTRLAAWCSAKGRVLALFRIVPVADGFLLLLDRSLVAPTLKRLRMFVLRSDVTITDYSDDYAALGLSGPAASQYVVATLGNAPETADQSVQLGALIAIRLPSHAERYLLLGPAEAVFDNLQKATAQSLQAVDDSAWRVLAIEDGRPEITELTRESLLPQMLNLEPLNGLSYTKGCYPGQEVVARLHYRGQLKRRLYRLAIETDEVPPAGAELDDQAGTIVSSAFDGQRTQALAVLRIDAAEADNLIYNGLAVRLLELPYPGPE